MRKLIAVGTAGAVLVTAAVLPPGGLAVAVLIHRLHGQPA
jgi:hypothetical protein